MVIAVQHRINIIDPRLLSTLNFVIHSKYRSMTLRTAGHQMYISRNVMQINFISVERFTSKSWLSIDVIAIHV
mgnify:FL=1